MTDMLPTGMWAAPRVWKEDRKDGSLFPWGWDYISACCPSIDRPVRTGPSLAQEVSGVGSDSGSASSSSGTECRIGNTHLIFLVDVLMPLVRCFSCYGEFGSRFQY